MPEQKYIEAHINPAYVQELELKLHKTRSAINIVDHWMQVNRHGSQSSQIYLAALKAIAKQVKEVA